MVFIKFVFVVLLALPRVAESSILRSGSANAAAASSTTSTNIASHLRRTQGDNVFDYLKSQVGSGNEDHTTVIEAQKGNNVNAAKFANKIVDVLGQSETNSFDANDLQDIVFSDLGVDGDKDDKQHYDFAFERLMAKEVVKENKDGKIKLVDAKNDKFARDQDERDDEDIKDNVIVNDDNNGKKDGKKDNSDEEEKTGTEDGMGASDKGKVDGDGNQGGKDVSTSDSGKKDGTSFTSNGSIGDVSGSEAGSGTGTEDDLPSSIGVGDNGGATAGSNVPDDSSGGDMGDDDIIPSIGGVSTEDGAGDDSDGSDSTGDGNGDSIGVEDEKDGSDPPLVGNGVGEEDTSDVNDSQGGGDGPEGGNGSGQENEDESNSGTKNNDPGSTGMGGDPSVATGDANTSNTAESEASAGSQGGPESNTNVASPSSAGGDEGGVDATATTRDPFTAENADGSSGGDGSAGDGASSAEVDTDFDGLNDTLEEMVGTNPLSPDSDQDGASDKEEYDAGTDALDPNDIPAFDDSNGDGISDAVDRAENAMDNFGVDNFSASDDGGQQSSNGNGQMETCTSSKECITMECTAGVCRGPGDRKCEASSDCRTGACALSSSTARSRRDMVCCRSGESIDGVCTGQVNGAPCTAQRQCASLYCNANGICQTIKSQQGVESSSNVAFDETNAEDIEADVFGEEAGTRDTGGGSCGTGCKVGAYVGGMGGVIAVAGIYYGAVVRKRNAGTEEVEIDNDGGIGDDEEEVV